MLVAATKAPIFFRGQGSCGDGGGGGGQRRWQHVPTVAVAMQSVSSAAASVPGLATGKQSWTSAVVA
eukprot:2736595-Pleurochrysis_carterae.AAC.2